MMMKWKTLLKAIIGAILVVVVYLITLTAMVLWIHR